jgi:membrane protein implicated in regulation of membrane protease activity
MESLIGFLDSLTVWHWWTLAVVLLVLELLTGTTYLLWPTVAAALVGLGAASTLPFPWEWQLSTFAFVTIVLTLAGDRFVAKRWLKSESPQLNERAAQLTGERVVAVGEFVAGRGRVRLGDSVWAAALTADADVSRGSVLVIEGVDGSTLKVRAFPPSDAAGRAPG